jgi:branched-chain amino acid transport system ATP-binding protein
MPLSVRNIFVGYGNKVVVRGASLDVADKEVVALIGHNGAGKTTLLNGIFGLLPVRQGEIEWNGHSIVKSTPANNVRSGLGYAPQGPQIYSTLTIRENLRLGAFNVRPQREADANIDKVFDLFPVLQERQSAKAGTLSGGERQMLAMGSIMAAGPKLVFLDEPSGGLAPMMVERMFNAIRRMVDDFGVSVLLIEQNIRAAFRVANRVYVMTKGTTVGNGTRAELEGSDRLREMFLSGNQPTPTKQAS